MDELQDIFVPSLTPHEAVIDPGTRSLPIADISLWPLGAIPTVFTFPGRLDEERLTRAISLLSSIYPSICGRYERHASVNADSADGGYDFSFNLTQSPIPFAIQRPISSEVEVEVEVNDSYFPFPDNSVVQHSLEPYIPPLNPQFGVANSGAPLFAVRLTYLPGPAGGCVLGTNWGHVLGDGQACLNAHKWLESFYLHGESALQEDVRLRLRNGLEIPSYLPHVLLPPHDPSLGPSLRSKEVEGVDVTEMMDRYTKAGEDTAKISVIFTQYEIDELRAKVLDLEEAGADTHPEGQVGGKTKIKLSDQDLLSGWWVDLHRRAGMRVDEATYTCNYRTFCRDHPAFPANLSSLVANVAQMRHFELPPAPTEQDSTPSSPGYRAIFDIARCIRE
ncbi:uncharacterized protein I303_107671 [Kwoniella dejecticola CBS 10117]|uniref:Transferase n=1 Tax=Kwoniella dejecticola CBS 10117 TaxID=1296121 RepID=A0A1A5ZVD4_9TREE|nr:uncharacterized protein I303_07680 [Kwoniella dejecticola CBS 10117]OBR81770.1 hypothetical protein I303_07680 [Kwoniella dejecticola CBS 10117]